MGKFLTKANAMMVLGHLKNNAVRYTIASTIVSLFGLAATETDKISDGINTAVTMAMMMLGNITG